MGDGGEGRRRVGAASWGRGKSREGIGEERHERDSLGFHRDAAFVPRESTHRATKLRDANEVVSPTDLWTTGPIGHGLLGWYYSFKQVKKVFTTSNSHR